jgi:hypothetical protein
VSWGGDTTWQSLNNELSDSLESVMIGDIDGDGLDDIVRSSLEKDPPDYDPGAEGHVTGTWQVSWGGASAWDPEPLATRQWPEGPPGMPSPADRVRSFIGRFDQLPGPDLLVLDTNRKAYINRYRNIPRGFFPYSLYAF